MASSSHNTFEGVDDFDQYYNQYCNQYFDQTFEDLCINHDDQEDTRKKRKKRVHIERNREEGNVRL